MRWLVSTLVRVSMDVVLARGNHALRDACPRSATIEFGVSNSENEAQRFS
jgi:hypothetical protein